MVRDTMTQSYDLFRPVKPQTPTGTASYVKAALSGVNLSRSSKGYRVSSNGMTEYASATLFYNLGTSSESPALNPLFQAGDMICSPSENQSPAGKRLIVQDVTEQFFKGVLHHYEVVLA